MYVIVALSDSIITRRLNDWLVPAALIRARRLMDELMGASKRTFSRQMRAERRRAGVKEYII